ncbi:hypothetical protein D3C84_527420 [compost metagenome]
MVWRNTLAICSRLMLNCAWPVSFVSPNRLLRLAVFLAMVMGRSSSRCILLTSALAMASKRCSMTSANSAWVRCCTSS